LTQANRNEFELLDFPLAAGFIWHCMRIQLGEDLIFVAAISVDAKVTSIPAASVRRRTATVPALIDNLGAGSTQRCRGCLSSMARRPASVLGATVNDMICCDAHRAVRRVRHQRGGSAAAIGQRSIDKAADKRAFMIEPSVPDFRVDNAMSGGWTRCDRARKKGARPWRVPDFKIELRKPYRPLRVVTRRTPELGGMVSESGRMAGNQFSVSLLCSRTPPICLGCVAILIQYAGQLRSVIRVIGFARQPAEPGHRALSIAKLSLHLGQMALGLRVGWQASPCGVEPVARSDRMAGSPPHMATLELKLRQRKRRHPAKADIALVEQGFSLGGITTLGIECGKPRDALKIGAALDGHPAEHQGLFIAPERLEDCCPLCLRRGVLNAEPLGDIEVTQRFLE
jgi:hypothetical protein